MTCLLTSIQEGYEYLKTKFNETTANWSFENLIKSLSAFFESFSFFNPNTAPSKPLSSHTAKDITKESNHLPKLPFTADELANQATKLKKPTIPSPELAAKAKKILEELTKPQSQTLDFDNVNKTSNQTKADLFKDDVIVAPLVKNETIVATSKSTSQIATTLGIMTSLAAITAAYKYTPPLDQRTKNQIFDTAIKSAGSLTPYVYNLAVSASKMIPNSIIGDLKITL